MPLTHLSVFAEHSDTRKPMQPGWNVRVFNRTESQQGSGIRRDPATGVVSLGPGVYHVTGSSQVTYNDLTNHPDQPGWNTEPIPNGGYCRLCYADKHGGTVGNEDAIAVGTISNANMVPSLIDTWLDVPRGAEIVLEHQVGELVKDIYLQDNAVHSTWHVFARIAIARAGDSHARSALCDAFDAALRTYLSDDPGRYGRLYATYLGVEPRLVPAPGTAAWPPAGDPVLAPVLRKGVLRFGYGVGASGESAPYVFRAANGELAGLDWELGNALTEIIRQRYTPAVPGKGLRAEWVGVQVPEGGDPEAARFGALLEALRAGRIDVGMSGQADIRASGGAAADEVDWTSPTELLFTNILYSGRGGHDLSGLAGGTRERFIQEVSRWPEVRLMCVQNPGPSPTNSAALCSDINAAGGNAVLDDTGTLPTIQAAIAEQTIDFSVGDAVASAWIAVQPGFQGLNLNVTAGVQPLQTAQAVAAFTLRP
jgi:ABC-type amino acid transport substrate-binding protein